jgi:SAM-dependent methyltransferase
MSPAAERLYVQVGCGYCAPDGWLNYDASPTLRWERLPLLGSLWTPNAQRFPRNARYGDVVRGLPLPDGSAAGVYASHMLEHLSLEDCRRALGEIRRLLAPGGFFRLVVPDLRARAARYLEASGDDPGAAHRFLRESLLGQERRPASLFAKLRDQLGHGRHLWMWDEPSMVGALQEAGFRAVRRCRHGDAQDPRFAEVEDPARFVDGAYRELALEAQPA